MVKIVLKRTLWLPTESMDWFRERADSRSPVGGYNSSGGPGCCWDWQGDSRKK